MDSIMKNIPIYAPMFAPHLVPLVENTLKICSQSEVATVAKLVNTWGYPMAIVPQDVLSELKTKLGAYGANVTYSAPPQAQPHAAAASAAPPPPHPTSSMYGGLVRGTLSGAPSSTAPAVAKPAPTVPVNPYGGYPPATTQTAYPTAPQTNQPPGYSTYGYPYQQPQPAAPGYQAYPPHYSPPDPAAGAGYRNPYETTQTPAAVANPYYTGYPPQSGYVPHTMTGYPTQPSYPGAIPTQPSSAMYPPHQPPYVPAPTSQMPYGSGPAHPPPGLGPGPDGLGTKRDVERDDHYDEMSRKRVRGGEYSPPGANFNESFNADDAYGADPLRDDTESSNRVNALLNLFGADSPAQDSRDGDRGPQGIAKQNDEVKATESGLPTFLHGTAIKESVLAMDLTRPNPAVVADLIHRQKRKCRTCGLRFAEEEKFRAHLDMHFKINDRQRQSARKASSRLWAGTLQDWIENDDILFGAEKQSEKLLQQQQQQKKSSEGQDAEDEDDTGDEESKNKSILADEFEGEETPTCCVCREAFKKIWSETEETWVLENARRIPPRDYPKFGVISKHRALAHKACYAAVREQVSHDHELVVTTGDIEDPANPQESEETSGDMPPLEQLGQK